MALVLLRFALGSIGTAEAISCFRGAVDVQLLWLGILLAVAAALVFIGLMTSYSATAVVMGAAFRALAFPSLSLLDVMQSRFSVAMLVTLGAAIALLGPGLFSLDFRLFGRREIFIPRRIRE